LAVFVPAFSIHKNKLLTCCDDVTIAGWEATFTACNQGGQLLTTADRMNLVRGICHILAALPESQRSTSLMALAMPSLGCLDAMIEQAAGSSQGDPILSAILDRAAAEIMILTAISRAFTDAVSVDTRRERTSDVHAALVEPSLAVIRRAWRSVAAVASMYGYHDVSILAHLGQNDTRRSFTPDRCFAFSAVDFGSAKFLFGGMSAYRM
jgi:hypothetical protein